jgi:ABC-type nitrate/sulfonate/bicarbonate transport system substrate-binding protein
MRDAGLFFLAIYQRAAGLRNQLTPIVLGSAHAQEPLRISYGGYNETAAPMWVGIDKGIFKKYGIDASMIQVRSGALSVATLVAKEVEAVYPAQLTIDASFVGNLESSGFLAEQRKKIK